MLDLEFMRLAFGAGAVVGVLAPTVGFFLVQREMSLIGDGIGHVAFAGVAAGYLLGISPVWTALGAALLGAAVIEWLRARRRTAGDQALAIVFYTGIAGGVVLVSAAGALNANLFAYLFGSILTVSRSDLAVIAVLGLCALLLIVVLLRGLFAVSLDEEGARVAGLPVAWLNGVVAMLAALTVGVSMRIVGILLIAALMVLPVVAAQRVAWSLRSTIGIAVAAGLGSALAGLTISYYADLPPGGTIVLTRPGSISSLLWRPGAGLGPRPFVIPKAVSGTPLREPDTTKGWPLLRDGPAIGTESGPTLRSCAVPCSSQRRSWSRRSAPSPPAGEPRRRSPALPRQRRPARSRSAMHPARGRSRSRSRIRPLRPPPRAARCPSRSASAPAPARSSIRWGRR
jgi:zinc transport system permease protein